ncbi:MAG: methyl-accepting chemotaxis protein, partial [Candidatus Riflebacteria bacterium]|nr:methyl-accepting chemotaxis protein [Candidatus Riflebacteria bacterium]
LARDLLKAAGGVQIADKGENNEAESSVTWNVKNQFTQTTSVVSLPKMMIGNDWFGQNYSMTQETPLVDHIKRLVGGTCTVFQRMNAQGDMLRVATNVENTDGTRAIGTFIPRNNPDGSPNPVISAILNGQTYRGRAFVVNAWYLTAYEPITNKRGEVIGILYVGEKVDASGTVKDALNSTHVGKTGFVAAMAGSGDNKGEIMIAREGIFQSNNALKIQDAHGDNFYADAIDKAVKLKNKEVIILDYKSMAKDENGSDEKKVAIAYFAPWDWVICAIFNQGDNFEIQARLEGALTKLLRQCLLTSLIVLFFVIIASYFFAAKIARPLTEISDISRQVASGNLLAAKEMVEDLQKRVVSHDETGNLLDSIQQMTVDLNKLVFQMQLSGIQMTSSATEIAASVKELEATATEQAAATHEVGATSREIAATSQELGRTMRNVSGMANETGNLADLGKESLDGMEGTMRQLVTATSSISSRFGIIKDRADDINSVVTTITKVADQTNLLSLNAAIEAEKAGEYGLGFAVVAREIRRLADQTAVATLDIEQMVKEMHHSVSTGIDEMTQFAGEVRQGVDKVQDISNQLGKIIAQVQEITPQIVQVNEGMQAQAEGAEQISESIVQLSEGASQTSDNLREFNKATSQLNEAARSLQNEVNKFRVSGKKKEEC